MDELFSADKRLSAVKKTHLAINLMNALIEYATGGAYKNLLKYYGLLYDSRLDVMCTYGLCYASLNYCSKLNVWFRRTIVYEIAYVNGERFVLLIT